MVWKKAVETGSGSGGSGIITGKSLGIDITVKESGTLPEPGQKGQRSLGRLGLFWRWLATMVQVLRRGFHLSSAIVIPFPNFAFHILMDFVKKSRVLGIFMGDFCWPLQGKGAKFFLSKRLQKIENGV